MTDINIGGVKFDKAKVKSAEKIERNGEKLNSVFMDDGTNLVFKDQEVGVSIDTKPKVESMEKFEKDCSVIFVGTTPITSCRDGKKIGDIITVQDVSNLEVNGTEKNDEYHVEGGQNIKIDVSKDDTGISKKHKNGDIVVVRNSKGQYFKNVEVKLGNSDEAVHHSKKGFLGFGKKVEEEGPKTFNTSSYEVKDN